MLSDQDRAYMRLAPDLLSEEEQTAALETVGFNDFSKDSRQVFIDQPLSQRGQKWSPDRLVQRNELLRSLSAGGSLWVASVPVFILNIEDWYRVAETASRRQVILKFIKEGLTFKADPVHAAAIADFAAVGRQIIEAVNAGRATKARVAAALSGKRRGPKPAFSGLAPAKVEEIRALWANPEAGTVPQVVAKISEIAGKPVSSLTIARQLGMSRHDAIQRTLKSGS